MISKEIEEFLRVSKIGVLRFIHLLASTDSISLELRDISDSTDTSEGQLRGVISTILKHKIDGKSLILQSGRDEKGRFRWQINEELVDKKELAKFLEEKIIGIDGLKIAKAT